MSPTDSPAPNPTDEVVLDLLDRALRGEALDAEALLASRPGLDDAERARLRAMAADLAPSGERRRADADPASADGSSARATPPAQPERFGPYEIVRELGRGAQGVVYLARDVRLGRRVALKVLNRGDLLALHDSSQSGPAARLKREAEIASKLDHPGICVVYEMGVEDGRPFIAMRFVEGVTLAARIAAAREERHGHRLGEVVPRSEGDESRSDSSASRRDVLRAVELVERIARTLHSAHRAHVVHRDLKPGNVMITPEGEPVILDFGLARDDESDASTLTATGQMVGSPAYMAPEQVESGRGTIDARTDVYALGVLLYECLTLRRPFESPTLEGLYRAILTAPPPDPRDAETAISRDLAIVIATALEKDRDRRYRTALDLAEDLRRVREHEPILARPAGPWLRLRRWTQRNPGLAASLVGAFLLLLSIIAGLQLLLSREREHVAQIAREKRRADAERLLAESVAWLPRDPARALRSAIAASELESLPDAEVNARSIDAMLALREVRVLHAHEGGVADARLSADGRTLVTCGHDLAVRIWDGATWELVRELPRFAGAPRISLGADGRWLATTSDVDPPRLWDTTTGESRRLDFPCEGAPVLSPDSKRIAVLTRERVEVWPADGEGAGAATSIDAPDASGPLWSPDGRWLMVGQSSALRLIRLDPQWLEFRSADGPPRSRTGGFSGADAGLAVLPSEHGFAVFDLERGAVRDDIALPPERASRLPSHARIDPRGDRVLVAYDDAGGDVFDAREGKLIARLQVGNGISGAEFSADGASILVRSQTPSGSALVCASTTGNVVADLVSSDVTHLALWQPGTGSAPCTTIHQSGMVRSWSLGGRFPRATVEFERGSSPGADGCEARGDRLVVASGRNAIVHSLATLAPLEALRGHEDVVNWVDQSSDGQWIATASMDCTACIWSAETSGEPRWSFPHEDPLWVAEFSPDGRWLATAGEAGRILLFDFLSGEPPVELFSNGRGLRCLRFDATGRRLVSVSEMDGWVRVFDLESRNEIASFFPGTNDMPTRRSGSPHSACFHPDGQRVAITTFGGRVLVWDVRGGEPIQAKLEVGPKTMDVEFSPDGTLLAVCGPAFAAQLLAADDLREIATLPGHAGAPIGLSFANEGRELVTLDTRNDVRVWPVDVVAAARRTLRSLEPIGLAAR